MGTIWFGVKFASFMIKSSKYKSQIEKLEKQGKQDEAKVLVNEHIKRWADFITKNVPINVERIGIENIPSGPCLFVGNHQSLLDITTLLYVLPKPAGFVAKVEMLKAPFLPYWMRKFGCVFIDRNNPREGIKAIKQGTDNIKNGQSMVIFPEGTRSKDGKLGEFKKGTLRMAIKAGVPVVPVSINGTANAFEYNNKKIRAANARVIIHKPIYIADMEKEQQEGVLDTIHEIIEKDLKLSV